MKDLVEIKDGKAITTSLKIAETFGKRHDHVLRKIDEIIKLQPAFSAPNFGEMSTIKSLSNGGKRSDRYYEITEAGYAIAVMSFTGEKALQFKVDYITEFERMRHAIESKAIDGYKTQAAWAMGELTEIESRQPNHKDSLACKLNLKVHQVGVYFKHLVGIGELEEREHTITRKTYHPTQKSKHVYGANGTTLLFNDSVTDAFPKNTDWTE